MLEKELLKFGRLSRWFQEDMVRKEKHFHAPKRSLYILEMYLVPMSCSTRAASHYTLSHC
jgi:hypothetical protein